jgi:hypothetical protein
MGGRREGYPNGISKLHEPLEVPMRESRRKLEDQDAVGSEISHLPSILEDA